MTGVTDTLIPDGTVSLSTGWESEPLYLDEIALLSLQVIFTGSPVGSFRLQCSGDRYNKTNPPANWTEVEGSTVAITEAGDITWNFEGVGFNWLKIIYTYTGGSGTLTSAQYNGKGV